MDTSKFSCKLSVMFQIYIMNDYEVFREQRSYKSNTFT